MNSTRNQNKTTVCLDPFSEDEDDVLSKSKTVLNVNAVPYTPQALRIGESIIQVSLADETIGSRGYQSPYRPQLKILRRPSNSTNVTSEPSTSEAVTTKSLRQREAEYAQARLRILGSTQSAGEDKPLSLSVPVQPPATFHPFMAHVPPPPVDISIPPPVRPYLFRNSRPIDSESISKSSPMQYINDVTGRTCRW